MQCTWDRKDVHEDFLSIMENCVLPRKKKHPNDMRLDGELSGSKGTQVAFGFFRHRGRKWKVDMDTRYEPLMLAYSDAVTGKDPFVEETTNGGGKKLILTHELFAQMKSRFRYLYIYSK
jgi:hypothetical protein